MQLTKNYLKLWLTRIVVNYIIGYMLNLIKKIVCVFKEHDLRFAGKCPYTMRTYNVCLRCNKTFIHKDDFDLSENVDKEDL